jgi:hypothetical protein
MNDFQLTLTRLLELSGKSVTQVALLGGVDRAYLKRLLSGEKCNPSETVFRIWMGISIDPTAVQRDPTFPHGLAELLHAAARSYAPSKVMAAD